MSFDIVFLSFLSWYLSIYLCGASEDMYRYPPSHTFDRYVRKGSKDLSNIPLNYFSTPKDEKRNSSGGDELHSDFGVFEKTEVGEGETVHDFRNRKNYSEVFSLGNFFHTKRPKFKTKPQLGVFDGTLPHDSDVQIDDTHLESSNLFENPISESSPFESFHFQSSPFESSSFENTPHEISPFESSLLESLKPFENSKPFAHSKPIGSSKPLGISKPFGSYKPLGSFKPFGNHKPSENPKPYININLISNRLFNDLLKKRLVKIQKRKKLLDLPQVNDIRENYTSQSIDVDYGQQEADVSDVDTIFDESQDTSDRGKFIKLPIQTIKDKTKKLANKFLSLFTVIQFPNARCSAISAANEYEGFCYHSSQCSYFNGTAIGNCANGFGVCCVSRQSCGGITNKNCTYFESPGYPNYFPMNGTVIPPATSTTPRPSLTPDPRYKNTFFNYVDPQDVSQSLSCNLRVLKTNPRIKQMRIDFIDLELKGPTNGECTEERLIISGENINSQIPILCGYNSRQHVYVDVTNLVGPLQISILSTSIQPKRHRIRVCQYEDSCVANMNCLQYFAGVQGVISSFNYEQSAAFSRSQPGYFNNLNYAICIRREAGFCSITYRNVLNGIEYPFNLVNFDGAGAPTVPLGQAGAEIFNCPDDYIVINGIRLCGYKLNDGSSQENFRINAPVTDDGLGPIIIPVRTDEAMTGRGFKLFYNQNRCT